MGGSAHAKIPDDKILIPGVINSTTNFVEHPRLIAQRICRYADIVGRERVIAGADCGFATFAFVNNAVAPSVVWAEASPPSPKAPGSPPSGFGAEVSRSVE